MLKTIKNLVTSLKIDDLTLDLTSGNTIIYQQGNKDNPIKVNEPAILVIDGDSCLAFGKEAEAISGKCPEGVKVVYPIQKGIIAEPNYCEQLLRHYFKTFTQMKSLFCIYPNVLAVIPQSATASTQKVITETIDAAGAKGIDLISSLQAAAHGIGSGKDTSGVSIIMNVAKDYTEIGIISLNKIHYASTFQVGYDDFQKSIVEYIRTNSEYTIGLNNAKKALDALGTAYLTSDDDEHEEVRISGLLKRTSTPADLKLTKIQVYTAIRPLVDKLISGLLEVLEKTKEDMADDLKENGVSIVGIGGRINRLDRAISEALNIQASIARNYETCIVRGAGAIQAARIKG
ncbi:rod shape-determining protein [Vibrio coralliirubri]|uniref:rod shape-determining protein n=1 Tax=Vibrio coralliirubri TaxID=1516159 RepID=UPI0022839F5B|nr:rod shape-determining protein [Vibrio coralliirubri]MCY9861029.1 rod shape-determining protein [Vibrio coralliirubri]